MKVKSDCIVAIATPVGIGALCVIRMSGSGVFSVFEKCVFERIKFQKSSERSILLYRLCRPGCCDTLDEVTAVKYKGPCSYTGEDMVEIISHGGKVCSRQIVEALVSAGSRVADRGEFTMRALSNGKMSLIEAESMHEVISSRSEIAKKRALRNYLGEWESSVSKWRKCLEEALTNLESRIEFSEEDDVAESVEIGWVNGLKSLSTELERELTTRKRITEKEKGIKVVFGGLRNAGKSSLFNCLVGYDRAIVDSSQGTTRDAIREEIVVDGVNVSLIDTAGLGKSGDRIEHQGMQRSEAYLSDADIIIWVTAGNEKVENSEEERLEGCFSECGKKKIVGVINKEDLGTREDKNRMFLSRGIPYFVMSAVGGNARGILNRFLVEQVRKSSGESDEGVVVSARQEGIVARLLEAVNNSIENIGTEEVAAEFCREAVEVLGELTGERIGEMVLGEIFNRFCIGK